MNKHSIDRIVADIRTQGVLHGYELGARHARALYPYPAPGIVVRDADGNIIRAERLRFIPLKDIRPLNLKQIAKEAA